MVSCAERQGSAGWATSVIGSSRRTMAVHAVWWALSGPASSGRRAQMAQAPVMPIFVFVSLGDEYEYAMSASKYPLPWTEAK